MSDMAKKAAYAADVLLDDGHPLPRLYVPTWGHFDGVPILEACPALKPVTTLVISEEKQAKAYARTYPDVEQRVVSDSMYPGHKSSIGRSRRAILDWAAESHILMIDEDVTDARVLALKPGGGITTKTISHMPQEKRLYVGLVMFVNAMEAAYAAVPSAVSGAPQSDVTFPKTFPKEAEVMWRLNAQDPFVVVSMRVDRYRAIVNYDLDLDKWGTGAIGEDKALSIETLLAGGDLVDVPSLLFKTHGQPSTVPRNTAVYKKTAANYAEYPAELFTKPRYDDELRVTDSWNIAWGKFRKSNPGRDTAVVWPWLEGGE